MYWYHQISAMHTFMAVKYLDGRWTIKWKPTRHQEKLSLKISIRCVCAVSIFADTKIYLVSRFLTFKLQTRRLQKVKAWKGNSSQPNQNSLAKFAKYPHSSFQTKSHVTSMPKPAGTVHFTSHVLCFSFICLVEADRVQKEKAQGPLVFNTFPPNARLHSSHHIMKEMHT